MLASYSLGSISKISQSSIFFKSSMIELSSPEKEVSIFNRMRASKNFGLSKLIGFIATGSLLFFDYNCSENFMPSNSCVTAIK